MNVSEVTSSIDKVQASPLPPQKLEMLLATLTSKVKGMEGRLTEATLFLPPYDVRRAQEVGGYAPVSQSVDKFCGCTMVRGCMCRCIDGWDDK